MTDADESRTGLRIRLASPEDVAFLEAIENAADMLLIERLRPDAWPPAVSGAARAADPGFLIVAEDITTGEPVGFAHVRQIGEKAHLEQISVLPQHGGQGIGRTLLNAAVSEARARGHRRLTLRTYAAIPWNAPFYASAGFAVEEAVTPLELSLVADEARLRLDQYGERVQMGLDLASQGDEHVTGRGRRSQF